MNHQFKVGDKVHYTNDQGVYWGVRTITELDSRGDRPTYYIAPTDTPWYAVSERCFSAEYDASRVKVDATRN